MRQSSGTLKQSIGPSLRRLLLSKWVLSAAMGVAAAISVVAIARPAGGQTTVWGVVMIAVIVALGVYVLIGFGLTLAGFDAVAPEIAERLASDPDQQQLLTRWLARARWARFVGGFAGVIAWILGTQTHGDLVVLGFGGIAAGAFAAELHHLRRPSGPRTARLDRRTVSDYLMTADARRMVGVAALAGVIAVVGLVKSNSGHAAAWGIGAVVVIGLAHLGQRRVAGRARPAVSEKLTAADDLVRELAIGRGLARPATYLGLAMLANAAYALQSTASGWGAVGFVARGYALYLWWHNRRLGLDFLLTSARQPLLA
jgi:hypothetical protein